MDLAVLDHLTPEEREEFDRLLALDMANPLRQLPNGWKPREYQLPLWNYLMGGGKRAVQVAHRRWGKDDIGLNFTAIALHRRPGTYWTLLPEAAQARKAIWSAVDPHTGIRRIDQAFPLHLRETTRDQEMFIRFKNGAIWQVVGSDNFNSLVGSPPVGLVMSEYAIANPAAWSYLRPILVENGGWALFIYTPRGDNHGKALLDSARKSPGWYADVSGISKTKAIPQPLLDAELQEMIAENGAAQGMALYNQEWECSFDAAVIGAFYAGEMEAARSDKRITNVPYDGSVLVDTYWDLGLDDATAVWFVQQVGQEIHLLEYKEWTQVPLTQVAAQVMSMQGKYAFGMHVLPHDAQAREMSSGRTRQEILSGILGNIQIAPRWAVEDGIAAVRSLFPRMWFDETRCAQGLEALRNYRRDYNEKTKTYEKHAKHDWSSHASDAVRMLAQTWKEKKKATERTRPRPRRASPWAA